MLKKMGKSLLAVVTAASLSVPSVAFAEVGERTEGSLTAIGIDTLLHEQAALSPDYSWYIGHEGEASFTLENASQVLAFANLVNGTGGVAATSFQGKSVSLQESRIYNLLASEWAPIGDDAHQFLGSFDGNGSTIDNFKISGEDRSSYLGFFGYIGSGGSVSNLTIGANARVSVSRDAASADVIHHVAGLAGFCGGTISNASNMARVTVESAVVQTQETPQLVKAVGGVAGECVFDMSNCQNAGAISVSQTSDPVGSVDNSGLVHFVGGVVGVLGDSTRVGTSEAAVAADSSKHGSLSSCLNVGTIMVDTPSEAGLDRFGMTAFARSVCVGGVVGYSQGSVSDCVNGVAVGTVASDVGYVRAEHGTSVGGIVGSLRGLIGSDNPAQRVEQDDGMAGNGSDPLKIADCTNYGDIYALNAAGGIAGYAGTYTSICKCINSERTNGLSHVRSWVVATRWNKPAPAGIVGSTCGDVSYCANFGTIVSGSWDDESKRTYKTASGYYVAGIAGMLSYYSKVDATTQTVTRVSPLPEVYGCYNAGTISAVSGMRQRGIVGENEGWVHHCALLQGVVDNDAIAYGGSAGDTEASGRVSDCTVYSASELKAEAPIELMNAPCTLNDWSNGAYWVPSVGSTQLQNFGYPVLSASNGKPELARKDVSKASATCTSNALYNGGSAGNEAVPTLSVTLEGSELTRNVDYYIVPQSGAVEVTTSGQPYKATVVGIGAYKGSLADIPYGISKGYLSECSVTVDGATFNYEVQYPALSSVTVKTPDGAVVSPDEYEIASLENSSHQVTTEPINKGNYTLTVKVKEGSVHFDTTTNNTASGTYRISAANIMTSIDFSKVTISFEGKTYPWVSASDEVDPGHPSTTLRYTGDPIKPTVSGVSYNGHALVEGTDYRIVYGNTNPENGDTTSHDANNVGVPDGVSVGCVTIRYVTNSNFTNYENMFFNIVDEKPMYRLYNPYTGEHFYTARANERDDVVNHGWTDEGVGWIAPPTSSKPVYRLYNQYGGEHHYTLNAEERDGLVEAGWNDEGIGWYSDDEEGTPLYRQYNPNAFSCNHNYTVSKEENDYLVSVGWTEEGIAWYGIAQYEEGIAWYGIVQ